MYESIIKIQWRLCVIILACILLSCGSRNSNHVIVYAGAGMKGPLSALAEAFQNETGKKVVIDFQGSGRLLRKIESGHRPHLYIPASHVWLEALELKGMVKEKWDIAWHIPVIVLRKKVPGVTSLEDIKVKRTLMVVGDPRATAIGRKTSSIIDNYGYSLKSFHIKARGFTVKQLMQWVDDGHAQGAIVWRADALESDQVRILNFDKSKAQWDRITVCRLKTTGSVSETAEDLFKIS